jgi:putative endonuclease
VRPNWGKHRLGLLGQKIARVYLNGHGYRVIEENFVCRWGEIDLIAIEKETLVFVEVRTRKSTKFLSPIETITLKKLKSVERTAKYYLCTHNDLPSSWQIDCLGVVIRANQKAMIDLRQNCLSS